MPSFKYESSLFKQLIMNLNNRPNYKLIYKDFIEKKHPHKLSVCAPFFKKKIWTDLDVIKLNKILLGASRESISKNQKYKSYDKKTILEILNYQKKNNLNNIQIANHFNISRNTLAKWKNCFNTK